MEVKPRTKTVTKTIKVEVNDGVTLNLSNEEAAALFAVVSQINSTNRFIGDICSNIYSNLDRLGFDLKRRISTTVDSDRYYTDLSIKDIVIPKSLQEKE